MSSKVALVIGRWQIFHKGHEGLLRAALTVGEKVIVVIGSSFRSRDTRNPFNWGERRDMILSTLAEPERARVTFLPIRDYFDDEKWNAAVLAGVAALTGRTDSITLVGWKKDKSSYYLDHFPAWRSVSVEPTLDIDATGLRQVLFGSADLPSALQVLTAYVPAAVLRYLDAWSRLPVFKHMATEHTVVLAYRKKYTAPFYLTADAVVTTAGRVLLVRRGGDVGKGLWALPGGFVNEGEQFYPAAVRELKEETGLGLLSVSMRSALRGQAVFDHPLRSPRGRLITTAFHFDFGNMPCPDVEGQDDAAEARFFRFEDIANLESQLFEDHFAILDHFLHIAKTT